MKPCNSRSIITFFLLLLISIFSPGLLLAQGQIIIPWPPRPHPEPLPRLQPVELRSFTATVQMKDGAGTVKLNQTFYNPNRSETEGMFTFPLPDEAQIQDFYLYINGEKTRGTVLDSKEAERVYTDIVRSMRDPALLEYAGRQLFQARIFPFPAGGERQIELNYAQALSYDNGTWRLSLPLRQSGQASIANYNIDISLDCRDAIGTIYSPSHEVSIERIGNDRARIHLGGSNLDASKDLILYYTIDRQEINGNLLSFRPRTDRDGYFLMIASPSLEEPVSRQAQPKDIIFVVDASGSMRGDKMEQAREALLYCLDALNPEDRFEIIRFSSSLQSFGNGLSKANSENKENARFFIRQLQPNGGTNIDVALQSALKTKAQPDNRLTSVIFLTDGLPTSGQTDIKSILENVRNQRRPEIRIFNFGVGYDVNTYLLDKLATDMHGSSTYVKPGENLEEVISGFYARNATPALTGPEIHFGLSGIYDIYPVRIPDLFLGQRVMILGRYSRSGETTARLSGRQAEKNRDFRYPVDFKQRESDNAFIATLWANRKVDHLLDDIRFNGENPELVESIKSLAEEYGIVTPYTSYLVTEQERELSQASQRSGSASRRLSQHQEVREKAAAADEESVGGSAFYDFLSSETRSPAAATGKGAVMSSRLQKKALTGERSEQMILTIRNAAGRSFKLQDDVWMQTGIDAGNRTPEKIDFLSDAWFALAGSDAQLRSILAVGEKILFEWKGKLYRIGNTKN